MTFRRTPSRLPPKSSPSLTLIHYSSGLPNVQVSRWQRYTRNVDPPPYPHLPSDPAGGAHISVYSFPEPDVNITVAALFSPSNALFNQKTYSLDDAPALQPLVLRGVVVTKKNDYISCSRRCHIRNDIPQSSCRIKKSDLRFFISVKNKAIAWYEKKLIKNFQKQHILP